MTRIASLIPGKFFHIYNRGNNRENIFYEERNYGYFLRLYAHHILPMAETYAYCLLKNHFHLLVKVKADLSGFQELTDLSQPFSNFFNAYARAVNKAYGRTGSLFQRPFNRIPVTGGAHLKKLVIYIHQNPQKHGFVTDFRDWPYSSYHVLLEKKSSFIFRENVLELFKGCEQLEKDHRQMIAGRDVDALTPDDFN